MLYNIRLQAFLICAFLTCSAVASNKQKDIKIMIEKEDKLIKREVLFGNPDKIATRLSPDGKYISFLAPKDGVMNVWVALNGDIDNAKVITNEKARGIRSYSWARNSSHIIYAQDSAGDENWHLYSVDVATNVLTALTPEKKDVRAGILKTSAKYPNEILLQLNDRVPEYFDLYRVNVLTGSKKLVYENKQEFADFTADSDFQIRAGYKRLPTGESEVYLFESKDLSQFKLFKTIAPNDMLTTYPLHITADGKHLYMMDSTLQNTGALTKVDLATGDASLIASDKRADISDYLANPKTLEIEGIAVDYLRTEWKIYDNSIAEDIAILTKINNGSLEIVSRTQTDDKWIVAFLRDNGPVQYYLFDRSKKEAQFLFSSNAKQEGEPFAKMYPIKITARDGLELVSYLTVPRWLDNGLGKVLKPVPLVINVHGGPNARDSWGYNPSHQWLANRGYAVLSVNYRGSTGFGKDFINAGDGQWARKMQDDLEDAVNWAVNEGIAEKDKVAIYGGSYGGYATLVGMSMTPDLYAAGIDIVGPSNLETLLKSIPPYWKPFLSHLTKIIGASYETEEGREFLKERSPLTYAKNIKKPLMIVQGANDPRVKQAESDQIVDELKKHNIPVVYLLYPDEGHGLARPENRMSFYANAEIFLANFIGGRYIPHDNNFPGSSIEVKEGRDITWTKDLQGK